MSSVTRVPRSNRLAELIERYGESHRHPTNVLIHWLCVPVIVWCTLALAWTLAPWLAVGVALATVCYYLTLAPAMAGIMALFATLCLASLPLVPAPGWIALGAFVVAWVFQFVGHRIEGRRPSFLEDLRFLLIGPLFLLAKAFRRLGIAS